MTQPDRPEVDDPRVLALAQARQQMAYENPFNFVCPPWEGLTEQEQHLSLLDARNYLRAALKAGLIPQPAGVAPATDSATLLRELADQQEATAATDVIRKRRSIATARRLFAVELRRMAAESVPAVAGPADDETPVCDHDSQVIDHEGAQFLACMKCGTNLGRIADRDAATRPAGGAQQPKETDTDRVVAYRSALPGALSIYCTRHTDELGDGVMPLTSDDLPDGGVCAACHVDVLIPQQPKETRP